MARQSAKKDDRVRIPAAVARAVLDEFDHRCAICGRANPQLHHIDENRSNSIEANLIPLCPNHHLLDLHAPTKKVDIARMTCFRRLRDPFILDPRFAPLWERMQRLKIKGDDIFTLQWHFAYDLAAFVGAMQMGAYYRQRVMETLDVPTVVIAREPYTIFAPDQTAAFQAALADPENHLLLEDVLVEMLRMQGWQVPLITLPKIRDER